MNLQIGCKQVMARVFIFLSIAFGMFLVLKAAPVEAATDLVKWDTLCVYGDEDLESTRIHTQTIGSNTALVLPASISSADVVLDMEDAEGVTFTLTGSNGTIPFTMGENIDFTSVCGDSNNFYITIRATDGTSVSECSMRVLCSSNIDAMYLVSEDPVGKGREWVESSEDKSNKAIGNMVLQTADGSVVYDGALTQIKGRGNSTWRGIKKPYQIKLDKKTDLLQTGNSDNKSKTWVLLANCYDPSLMRNTSILNLGNAIGMEMNVESTYVDLYYDGEYRGCYLLAEKVEVGDGRVAVTDMEDLNEDANAGTDIETLPTTTGTTANGATYTYCTGMKAPSDITGGYLLELDYEVRALEEVCYFKTTRGQYVVVKSPEYASKEEMAYISALYQEYEDAVFNGGMNPTTGKAYTEYVDLESSVQCCLVNEFAKNVDTLKTSAYFYKEAGQDTMKMGPLWDYDLSLGMDVANKSYCISPEGLNTFAGALSLELYKLTDFRIMAKDMYANELYPLIKTVLLGDSYATSADGTLHSLEYYQMLLEDAAVCDRIMWGAEGYWDTACADLEDFVERRAEFLRSNIAGWPDVYGSKLSFMDVSEGAWYYDEVCSVVEYGLMQGVSSIWFDPDTMAERCHVTQTLFNMENEETVLFQPFFTDVAEKDWFSPSVIWAADKKVVLGYPDGTFKPNDDISREDLMVLLYRYQGSPFVTQDGVSKFSDANQVSSYAKDAVQWAVQEGIVEGYPDNTIQPKDTVVRSELATILVRYYERYELEDNK